MGVSSTLALLLISHQLLLHSDGENNICPDSYDCGSHGQIRFPCSNITYPQCGLFTMNCSTSIQKINLGLEGLWYEVRGNFLNDSVYVNDPRLEDLIHTNSCDVFSSYLNWTNESMPSISFITPTGLTLFKCTTLTAELDHQTDDFFHDNTSFRGCQGYTVYCKFPPNYNLVSTFGFPPNGTVIQLPALSEKETEIQNARDLFSVLSSEFSVRFHGERHVMSVAKREANVLYTLEFQCMKEKEGRRKLSVILGTAAGGTGFCVNLLFCIVRKLAPSESKGTFWKKKSMNYRSIEAFLKSCGSLSPSRYTYSDVKKMNNFFRCI